MKQPIEESPPAGGAAPTALDESEPQSFFENLRVVWQFQRYFAPYLLPAAGLLLLALLQADLNAAAARGAGILINTFETRVGSPGTAQDAVAALQPEPEPGEGGGPLAGGSIMPADQLFSRLASGALENPVRLALLIALFLVMALAVRIVAEQIRSIVNESFRQRLQTDVVAALSRELADTRGRRNVGNTSQIFLSDAPGLSSVLIFGLIAAAESLVMIGVYTYQLWGVDNGWIIALILFPVLVVFQMGMAKLFLKPEARAAERSERYGVQLRSRAADFFDVLSRLVYIKGDRAEARKLLSLAREGGRSSRRLQFVSSLSGGISEMGTTLSLPLVVVLLSLPLVIAALPGAATTAGTIIEAQFLLALLTGASAALVGMPAMLAGYSPVFRRVKEILDVADPGPRPARFAEVGSSAGPPSVALEEVDFIYPGAGAPLLQGLSFQIPAGACVAVVGPSGCGKSTLARLLLGDLRPTSGRILMDGVDITDWHLWWRREFIGFLPAEQGFLRGTLEENVLFGRSRDEIRDYLAALQASGVAAIAREKDRDGGMQMMIEGKVEDVLSTGQRRKVGIARLLAGDHRLWIFDEPGAGLDPRSMGEVAQALEKTVEGRTSIIITHDPDVFITDFVIFMMYGTVADIGPHAELFESNPDYRSLVQRFEREREEQELVPALATAAPQMPGAGGAPKVPER